MMKTTADAWDEQSALRRAAGVLVLGAAAALTTGMLHTSFLAITHYGFKGLVWFPREFFWMSPLAYAAVFLPATLALSLLALMTRSRRLLSFAAFAFGIASAFGLMLPFTQIAKSAALVLAAGIGVALARLVSANGDRWIRWSQRVAVAGIPILAVAGALQVLLAGRSRAAPTAESPNVLLIIMDDVRARNVTLNQPDVLTMPSLQRRAAESVVFDLAFSAAPWSLPSHASIFTGLYARQQQGDWLVPMEQDVRTLAETLRDRGYATGGFVANMHYAAWDSGLGQGFEHYEDFRRDWVQILRCSSYTQTATFTKLLGATSSREVLAALVHPDLSIVKQHTFRVKLADRIASDFLGWQADIGSRPFFAFLNVMEGHLPWLEPEPVRSTFPPESRGQDSYDAAIASIDTQIEVILDSLQARGALDNTVVIVTADHGDLFQEHGLAGHNSLYLDVLHVPLLIRFPQRVPPGTVVSTPVSLRDLSATVLDLTSVRATLPGSSLRHAWEGHAELVSPVLSEVRQQANLLQEAPAKHGDMRSLIDDSLHYIVNEGTGREELYAWRVDPGELVNLAERDSTAPQLVAWRERLARVLRDVGYATPNVRP